MRADYDMAYPKLPLDFENFLDKKFEGDQSRPLYDYHCMYAGKISSDDILYLECWCLLIVYYNYLSSITVHLHLYSYIHLSHGYLIMPAFPIIGYNYTVLKTYKLVSGCTIITYETYTSPNNG